MNYHIISKECSNIEAPLGAGIIPLGKRRESPSTESTAAPASVISSPAVAHSAGVLR